MDADGVEVLILTADQRRDLVAALTTALDAVEDTSEEDSPQVPRWVGLINLIQEGAPA
jgi:hypothetical protein